MHCTICGARSDRRICPACDRDIQRRADELTRYLRGRIQNMRRMTAAVQLARKQL